MNQLPLLSLSPDADCHLTKEARAALEGFNVEALGSFSSDWEQAQILVLQHGKDGWAVDGIAGTFSSIQPLIRKIATRYGLEVKKIHRSLVSRSHNQYNRTETLHA